MTLQFSEPDEWLPYFYPATNDISQSLHERDSQGQYGGIRDLPERFVQDTLRGKEDVLKGEFFSRNEVFGKMKELYIKCMVTQGMFSHERGIRVELPDGDVCAFADKRQVKSEEPAIGQEVQGKVKVHIVKYKKDTIIVDLPQPGFTKGPRIEISKDMLESD